MLLGGIRTYYKCILQGVCQQTQTTYTNTYIFSNKFQQWHQIRQVEKKIVWLSVCCATIFDVPTYPTSRPVTTETTPVFLIFYHQYIDTHHFLLHIVNHSPSYIKATLVSAVIISNVLSSHCAPNKPFRGVFTAAICCC